MRAAVRVRSAAEGSNPKKRLRKLFTGLDRHGPAHGYAQELSILHSRGVSGPTYAYYANNSTLWKVASIEICDHPPFNRRILAEDLVRVRRPDDRERYAASQRQARIDPNPHQIDAVIFALRRLREGGCILADEVGWERRSRRAW